MAEMERPVPTSTVAEFLNVARSTIDRWRRQGKGPPYRRIGNRCMYLMSEVQEWLEAERRDPQESTNKAKSLFGR